LLNVALIPATTLYPVPAFTFRVMKLFHILNLVGRLTPWDFCGTMEWLTDNADSRNVQVSSDFKVGAGMQLTLLIIIGCLSPIQPDSMPMKGSLCMEMCWHNITEC
ncbi:hypothetical protein BU17DRAFT_56749, partial [Hysterangium stoloniferum]